MSSNRARLHVTLTVSAVVLVHSVCVSAAWCSVFCVLRLQFLLANREQRVSLLKPQFSFGLNCLLFGLLQVGYELLDHATSARSGRSETERK